MLIPIFFGALLSTLPLTGDITTDGGEFELVDFEVPAGTVEIRITPDYPDGEDVLDFGIWSPAGMRGWSGGLRDELIVGEQESSRGYLPGPIEVGTWTFVIGKAKIDSSSVPWTATVEFHDASSLTARERAEFDPVVLGTDRRWYAGDFHVHSDESGDAPATLDEIGELARSQGLDFIAISDHNTASGHPLQAAMQADSSDLLIIRANEYTTYHGHGNVLGYSELIDHRLGVDDRTTTQVVDEVTAAGATFVVNHPTLGLFGDCIGCSWESEVDWSKVAALEVHNGNYDLAIAVFTPSALELWEEKSAEGHKMAAIGGSDDHRAGIDLSFTQSPIGNPTTWVLSDGLSEAAILQGLEEGRSWIQLTGPGGPVIDLRVSAPDGEEGTIGDSFKGHELEVELQVQGAEGLVAALVRDGEVVETQSIDAAETTIVFEAEVPEAGARFHVEVRDSQIKALTSHFYGEYEKPPASSGCGCTGGPVRGRDAGGLLFVLLAIVAIRFPRSKRRAS